MKILFVGCFNWDSTNYSQAQCLEEFGAEVYRYEYRQIESKIGPKARDQDLINILQHWMPDALLIAKGSGINKTVLLNTNAVRVLWFPDSNNGNFNDDFIQRLKHVDLGLFALRKPLELAKQYNPSVCFLAEGFDSSVDLPYVVSEKLYNVSFIGNLDPYRVKYITAENVTLFDNAYGAEHAKVVSQSKINLNFTRNEDGTSDRTYKILAAGGFLLTQPWHGMELDFIPGKHFETFRSVEEMKKKINYYLHHQQERLNIAHAGYEHNMQYSRIQWAKFIIEKIQEIGELK